MTNDIFTIISFFIRFHSFVRLRFVLLFIILLQDCKILYRKYEKCPNMFFSVRTFSIIKITAFADSSGGKPMTGRNTSFVIGTVGGFFGVDILLLYAHSPDSRRAVFHINAYFLRRSSASERSAFGKERFMRMDSGPRKASPFCHMTPARTPRWPSSVRVRPCS